MTFLFQFGVKKFCFSLKTFLVKNYLNNEKLRYKLWLLYNSRQYLMLEKENKNDYQLFSSKFCSKLIRK